MIWDEIEWNVMRCDGMTWHGMTWHDMAWHDMAWHDMTWHDTTWHDMTWIAMTWHDLTWHGMTWDDMRWDEMKLDEMKMIWDGMIWYGMKCDDMRWDVMRCYEMRWDGMGWNEMNEMTWDERAQRAGNGAPLPCQEDNLVRERRVGGKSLNWLVGCWYKDPNSHLHVASKSSHPKTCTYTHVWRTTCTSASLRTSIRVSSEFALHQHSSPSLGS